MSHNERPFGETRPTLETYLLAFHDALYRCDYYYYRCYCDFYYHYHST